MKELRDLKDLTIHGVQPVSDEYDLTMHDEAEVVLHRDARRQAGWARLKGKGLQG